MLRHEELRRTRKHHQMTSRLGYKSEKPHRPEDPYWSKREKSTESYERNFPNALLFNYLALRFMS